MGLLFVLLLSTTSLLLFAQVAPDTLLSAPSSPSVIQNPDGTPWVPPSDSTAPPRPSPAVVLMDPEYVSRILKQAIDCWGAMPGEVQTIDAIYRSPSQALREQADRLDYCTEARREFEQLISRFDESIAKSKESKHE